MVFKKFIKGLLGENDINDEYFVYDYIHYNRSYTIHNTDVMAVNLNGKCGIIEITSLKEVVPCKFEGVWDTQIEIFAPCYTLKTKTGKWIYLNMETWKEFWPYNEPGLYYYLSDSNTAIVKKDKKFIFIDNKGNPMRSYTDLMPCKHVFFARDQYDKWGTLDRLTGKETSQFVYNDVKWIHSTPFYFVLRNRKYGIIDSRSGVEVIPCKYDNIKYNEYDMIAICVDDKWGFLDRDTLEEKISCAYQDVSRFYGDYAAVKQRGKWGAINRKGDKVILSKYQNVLPTPSGLFCVWENCFNDCKIIDLKECVKYYAQAKYDDLYKNPFTNVLKVASGISKYPDGAFNVDEGKEILCCDRYDSCYIGARWEHAIYFEYENKKGKCDDKGKEIIPCRYDWISGNSVKLNGKWGYYNGWERVPCEFDSPVEGITENLYCIRDGKKKIYYNAITKKEIKGFNYSSVERSFTSNNIIIKNDEKLGLYSLRDTKEIIPCVCEDYKMIGSNLYIAFKKNGKWGIFNSEGKPINIKHTIEEKENPKEICLTTAKQDKPVAKTQKETTESTDIETLISAAIIDGELSDKERKVLIKKAKLAGLDVEEFEILLDAKLYEIQSKAEKRTSKLKEDNSVKTEKKKVVKKKAKSSETPKITKKVAKEDSESVTSKAEKRVKKESKVIEKPKKTKKSTKEEKKSVKKATKVTKSKP